MDQEKARSINYLKDKGYVFDHDAIKVGSNHLITLVEQDHLIFLKEVYNYSLHTIPKVFL